MTITLIMLNSLDRVKGFFQLAIMYVDNFFVDFTERNSSSRYRIIFVGEIPMEVGPILVDRRMNHRA